MYGLLCENLRSFIIASHGEEMWNKVRDYANIKSQSFILHDIYSENMICRLAKAYATLTDKSTDQIMHEAGVSFVTFCEMHGYAEVLKVLGRNLRDFLNGLDSLHEYLRFSYTSLQPPSFYVEKETENGVILHYVSKRFGYINYVIGQIEEVGKKFYDVAVDVKILEYNETEKGCHVIMDLIFDNKAYTQHQVQKRMASGSEDDASEGLGLDIDLFMDIFPFFILIDKNMRICAIGNGLSKVINEDCVVGKAMTNVFHVIRPSLDLSWDNLVNTNVLFEVKAKRCFKKLDRKQAIKLTGNMKYVPSLESMVFLASPLLDDLDMMSSMGVYVSDLALHDASRDVVLQCVNHGELNTALDRERVKSKMLEESLQSLEIERKRADSLLYRMIPKQIANRLRKGYSLINTCETFESVTVLFSDVVGFTNICSKISPMEVVTMLNSMYMRFDQLSVQCGVYKVETIGDGYMLASGIPDPCNDHADNVADMALEMMQVIKSIPNPANGGKDDDLKIRTGIHTGMVVAGVVGVKMPRYCLFGDTVELASLMESSGSPDASHINETTMNALTEGKYRTRYRGTFGVKGNFMKTYWLLGTNEDCTVPNILNSGSNLPTECLFSRSRENTPVFMSARRRLISGETIIEDGNEGQLSPTYPFRWRYSEIEQYFMENNIVICSEESSLETSEDWANEVSPSYQTAVDIPRGFEQRANQDGASDGDANEIRKPVD